MAHRQAKQRLRRKRLWAFGGALPSVNCAKIRGAHEQRDANDGAISGDQIRA